LFSKINIVPRWFIFLLYLGICVASLIMSYFLRHNLDVNDIDIIEISINVLILSLSKLLFFSMLKPIRVVFILAEAKIFGVIHNISKKWYKWLRIILSQVEHLQLYSSMQKRKIDLLNGTPLDSAHVKYHTVSGIDNNCQATALKLNIAYWCQDLLHFLLKPVKDK